MKTVFGFLRGLWRVETFSPTAFLVRAVVITAFFCLSELLGLREYTTFLSGTTANVNLSWQTAAALGLIHLLLYVGFVGLVPVFVIAAGLVALWVRWQSRKRVYDKEGSTPV